MLNLFLQAFDEGWITDGRGKRVYLSDAIVIMTSNVGSEHFRKLTQPARVLLEAGRRRAGAGRDQARARAPVLAGVPQPHRRGRLFRPLTQGRSPRRSRCSSIDEDRRDRWRRAGKTLTVDAGGARAARDRRLQPGLRRAVPEARDRRRGSSCRSASAGRKATSSRPTCAKASVEIDVAPAERRLLRTRGDRLIRQRFTRAIRRPPAPGRPSRFPARSSRSPRAAPAPLAQVVALLQRRRSVARTVST